jgi:hypothetical protein
VLSLADERFAVTLKPPLGEAHNDFCAALEQQIGVGIERPVDFAQRAAHGGQIRQGAAIDKQDFTAAVICGRYSQPEGEGIAHFAL